VICRKRKATFRIFQEALNNVRKQANAQSVRILLDLSDPDTVVLTVGDDGLGFDMKAGEMTTAAWKDGLGLRAMKDRAGALGGRLVVKAEPDSGTEITATLRVC